MNHRYLQVFLISWLERGEKKNQDTMQEQVINIDYVFIYFQELFFPDNSFMSFLFSSTRVGIIWQGCGGGGTASVAS